MKIRRAFASSLTAVAVAHAFAAGDARADAGLGPAPGNALNPAPVNPSTVGRWMYEEGMGGRFPSSRSPTGLLYDIPLDPGEEPDAKRKGWEGSCFVELGGLYVGGDDRNPGFLTYKDVRSGAYLNLFAISMEKREEARYVEATGGGVGMHDQFYRFRTGRYNDWKVSAFYDETPQMFTNTYRSLWNGLGTANLALNGLAPGGAATAAATQANIQNALAATEATELEVVRRKAGARFDKNLSESWKLFASFSSERREGARPFGAVFGGGGGGGNMELAEPIDYRTHEVLAGVQFNDSVSSFNLRAAASFFRNDTDTLTFQNPLYISLNGSSGLSPRSFTQGRFDLAPGNEHYNLKGEYARALPDLYRGSFTATVALGSMRQDDTLIPPTAYPLTGGTVTAGGASLANVWNTPAALSRQTADARIDTRLADFGLALKPTGRLDVRGKLRYYETDNSTQYVSCNPLTGQWGRLLNDGSGLSIAGAHTMAGVNPPGTSANAFNAVLCDLAAAQALGLVPSAGNIPILSVPNDYRQVNASLAADYRLGRTSSLNAAIEREDFRREFRERNRTWEDRIKLGYVDRALLDGTMRLSYEHSRRGGGEYDPNPYEPFLSASLGPAPAANNAAVQSWLHNIEQFRSFDLADRTQNVLNARINHAFLPALDAAVTLQLKDAQFPAPYGRTGHQKSGSVTLDLTYNPGAAGELYGFLAHQTGSLEQRGIQPNNCVLGYTYYHYSDGQVLSAATGAARPATPPGTTLVATQNVGASNWREVCGTASATSPLFPESRAWDVASRDRNDVIGVGFKYDFGKAKLDGSFTRTLGRTRIGYSYNPAALGLSPAQVALAGDGWSDLTFAQSTFTASVLVPINRTVALRVLARYESGRIRDWHYDGLASNPMPTNNAVYLDSGPQDYRATLLGLFLQVRL